LRLRFEPFAIKLLANGGCQVTNTRLYMCLLCGLTLWASGCGKSRVDAVSIAGNAAVAVPANNPAGMAAAGRGEATMAAVSVTAAGMSASATSGGTTGAAGSQGGAEVGSAGQAGTSLRDEAVEAGMAGNASTGGAGGQAAGAAGSPSRPIAKFPIRNLIVGACESTHAVPDPSTCTGWDALYECTAQHCPLAACEKSCANFLACAGAAPNPCDLKNTCPTTNECSECTLAVEACATPNCESLFRCATPSSGHGGACDSLNACCVKQTNPLGCSTWVQRAGALLGDAGCQMLLIDDPGFLKAYVNDPPCTP
jgi:hypothetical protein